MLYYQLAHIIHDRLAYVLCYRHVSWHTGVYYVYGCSVLQCDAVCCSVLQCAAVCCGGLQCVAVTETGSNSTKRRFLVCVAMFCSVCCVAVCDAVCGSDRDRQRVSKETGTHGRLRHTHMALFAKEPYIFAKGLYIFALEQKRRGKGGICAAHCNTLQHTATHCNTLQHTATHCIAPQHTAIV